MWTRRLIQALATRGRSAQDRVRMIDVTHYRFDRALTRKVSRTSFQQTLEAESALLERFGLRLLPLQPVSIDIRFSSHNGRHFETARLSFPSEGCTRLVIEKPGTATTDWEAFAYTLAQLFEKHKKDIT